MDDCSLFEAMFKRKSVRRYLPEKLDDGKMSSLRSYMERLMPLFPGIRTELRVLPPEHIKGIFKVDAPHYLAIYSERKPGHAANAGFILQQVDLHLSSRRLGGCWQGGPKPTRKAEPSNELEYVICLAFGAPAEEPWRNGPSEFKRKPMAEISSVRDADGLMEPVRLAPSGINNQSWYYSGDEERVDAYHARSMVTDEMNRINVGIGLCHLWLAARHQGMDVEFSADDGASSPAPKGFSHVASAAMRR
jgi:nitroreductase